MKTETSEVEPWKSLTFWLGRFLAHYAGKEIPTMTQRSHYWRENTRCGGRWGGCICKTGRQEGRRDAERAQLGLLPNTKYAHVRVRANAVATSDAHVRVRANACGNERRRNGALCAQGFPGLWQTGDTVNFQAAGRASLLKTQAFSRHFKNRVKAKIDTTEEIDNSGCEYIKKPTRL